MFSNVFSQLLVAGVGKSCLLLRFSDGSFTTSFITTIGFVFYNHFKRLETVMYVSLSLSLFCSLLAFDAVLILR